VLRYTSRRLVHAAVVILVVLTAVFFVAQGIGDPVRLALPLDASPEQAAALTQKLGLDDSLLERFWRFLSGAVQGDFGNSLWLQQPALGLALDRVGATFLVATTAIALSVVVGVPLGMLAAARGGWVSSLVSLMSLTAVSIVEFWFALILIYIFAVQLSLLPTSGYGGIEHLVLPALVLSLRTTGRLAQFTRTAIGEELRKPYVRAAVARGIPRRRIVGIHCFKNISVPLLTLTSDEFISVFSTAIVIEVVFAWPGLGSLMLQAIEHRDLPLVQSCVFIFTLVVVLVNLLVDLIYGSLDRRARVTS